MSNIDKIENFGSSDQRIETISAYLNRDTDLSFESDYQTSDHSPEYSIESIQEISSPVSQPILEGDFTVSQDPPVDAKTVEATIQYGNEEVVIDSDGDGVPDQLDVTPDSEKINSGTIDSDGDGISDSLDVDGNESRMRQIYKEEEKRQEAIKQDISIMMSMLGNLDLTRNNGTISDPGGISLNQMNDIGVAQTSMTRSQNIQNNAPIPVQKPSVQEELKKFQKSEQMNKLKALENQTIQKINADNSDVTSLKTSQNKPTSPHNM